MLFWGSGTLQGKIVSDGDAVQVQEQVFSGFVGNFRSPQQAHDIAKVLKTTIDDVFIFEDM